MFGLEQIAWADFISLLASLLVFWYLALLFMAWRKENTHQRQMLFEDDADSDFTGNDFSLLKVSERDFPSEMIGPISNENISLVSSFYEETGLDEGYQLDYFLGGHEATAFSILSQVQYE